MFGMFNKNKEVEISREELNDMRAARISESLPKQTMVKKKVPLEEREEFVASGTGLIKGIEFGPDTMPIVTGVSNLMPINVPVNTIYPPINSYIGNVMDFQQIHDYNNTQDVYFQNSAKILLAERVNFLIDNIIEEFRISISALSKNMKEEAREINIKVGKNCEDCFTSSCADCPANMHVDIYSFVTSKTVFQLLPQLIDIDFYNTIKNTGGIIANKELIQVTSMAFASILLNKANVKTIDEIAHIEAMDAVNTAIQIATINLIEMVKLIVEDENIINLVDSNKKYGWKPIINAGDISNKL